MARIEEIKNIPIINLLDTARPPIKKSYPRQGNVATATFLLSFVLAAGYTGFRRQVGEQSRRRFGNITGKGPTEGNSLSAGVSKSTRTSGKPGSEGAKDKPTSTMS